MRLFHQALLAIPALLATKHCRQRVLDDLVVAR